MDEPVSGDELLRFGERAIDDGPLRAVELDARPFRAGMQPLARQHDAGPDQLLVVSRHGLQQLLAGHHTRFALGCRLHDQHESHGVLASSNPERRALCPAFNPCVERESPYSTTALGATGPDHALPSIPKGGAMFFSGWSSVLRVFAVGVPAYIGLVVLLRISGKRTLSKFNAFDFVVTVAFGSVLASALLTKTIALSDVLAAFALLIGLQFLVTWSSVRWSFVDHLVKSEPQLLFHHGEFLAHALRRQRIARTELLSAIRSQGVASLDDVDSVVLEIDGTLSVVTMASGSRTAMHSVRGR